MGKKSIEELDKIVQTVVQEHSSLNTLAILEKAIESYKLYKIDKNDTEAKYIYYNISLNLLLKLKKVDMNSFEYNEYSRLKSRLLEDPDIVRIYNSLVQVHLIHITDLDKLVNPLVVDFESVRTLQVKDAIRIDPILYTHYDYSQFHKFENIVVYSPIDPTEFVQFLKNFIKTPIYILKLPKIVNQIQTPPKASYNAKLAPPSKKDPSKKKDLSNLHVLKGIYNIGNTCYMNVIIQSIFSTVPFVQNLLSPNLFINEKSKTKGLITKQLIKLLYEFLKPNAEEPEFDNHGYNHEGIIVSESVLPNSFKTVINNFNPNFNNEDEQDCLEFLDYLLDSLHAELRVPLKEPKLSEADLGDAEYCWLHYLKYNNSPINLFQGQLTNYLECEKCGTIKTNSEVFNTLSVPTLGRDIQTCLNRFQSWEKLEGIKCDKCKEKTTFQKAIKLSKSPQILIICLKRFNAELKKIDNFIDYSNQLILSTQSPTSTGTSTYNLYSIVNHQGDFSEGHYTNFSWKGAKNKWCFFNDDLVLVNIEKERIINSDAYILFYAKAI